MELQELVKLSRAIAKPYMWAVGILSALLLVSVGGNIYMASLETEVIIEQENIEANLNTNGIRK